MSELKLTQVQHAFFLAVLNGKSAAEAFRIAKMPTGKSYSDGAARKGGSRMLDQASVRAALARARASAAARADLTVDDLVARLERITEIALSSDPPQTSGAVAATLGIGKLLGLMVEKRETTIVHKPAFSSKALELSEDEWTRQFDPTLPLPDTHNER